MFTSLSRGNLHFTAIIIAVVILLLVIPGLALGQDNQEENITQVEIDITDQGNGFFANISSFIWILGIVLLVIVILLVFLVGRSRSV